MKVINRKIVFLTIICMLSVQENTYLENLIPQIMGNPDYAKQKMGIVVGDAEYEARQKAIL